MKSVEQYFAAAAEALEAARQLYEKQSGCRHPVWVAMSESGPTAWDYCQSCGLAWHQRHAAAEQPLAPHKEKP